MSYARQEATRTRPYDGGGRRVEIVPIPDDGGTMPGRSALKAAGSTARWRRLRAEWAKRLPMPCWRCGGQIEPDPPGTRFAVSGWVLGHVGGDRVNGAGDEHLAPEHRSCSDSSGGSLSQARRKLDPAGPPRRPGPRTGGSRGGSGDGSLGPSREW